MAESRIEATDRLRREGRWAEASAYREQQRQQFRAAGQKRAVANDAAWEAMLAEFPPLPTPDPVVEACPNAAEVEAILAGASCGEPDPISDVAWVYERLGVTELEPNDVPGLGAWSLWRSDGRRLPPVRGRGGGAARGLCARQRVAL